MESNEQPTLRPSSDAAQASLDDVRRVEADLADRLVCPWWYYTGMGLVEALLVSSMAFPSSLRHRPPRSAWLASRSWSPPTSA